VFLSLSLLLAGLLLLTLSADRFVLAAARLSRAWGLSPVLIGALVIGLGTSAPELLVSVLGAARGELDIAVGNVVGSNVSNVTLVLGTAALVGPVASRVTTIRREGALMFGAVTVLAVLLWDLRVGRIEGLALMAGMAAAAWLLTRWARSEPPETPRDGDEEIDYRPGCRPAGSSSSGSARWHSPCWGRTSWCGVPHGWPSISGSPRPSLGW